MSKGAPRAVLCLHRTRSRIGLLRVGRPCSPVQGGFDLIFRLAVIRVEPERPLLQKLPDNLASHVLVCPIFTSVTVFLLSKH